MNAKTILLTAALAAAIGLGLPLQAQRIDPATGMPAGQKNSAGAPPRPNAETGLPEIDAGNANPGGTILEQCQTVARVQSLTSSGQYDAALQRLLAYHEQFKLNGSLSLVLPAWIELGRRYPEAKVALVKIRDQYQNEFDAGRGYAELFAELYGINSQLDQDDASYALFQSLRQKDRKLAEQCYGTMAPLLIQRGEFDLCLSYLGSPLDNFHSIQQNYEWQMANLERLSAMTQQNARRLASLHITNQFAMPQSDPVQHGRTMATNSFVNGTRQLIEILVGARRPDEAQAIADSAAAVLDDVHLKSAVSDAEAKVKKTNPLNHNPKS